MSDNHFSSWSLLAAFLLLSAGSVTAHAAQTLLATCTGEGADFLLTEVSEADAAIVYDLPAPPGDNAVLVVNKDGSDAHWSTDSRKAIDKECGGEGKDEIGLFQPIQPRDGTWSIKITDKQLHGCSGLIARAVNKGMSDAMGGEGTHPLSFDKPFHPRPLLDKADREIHWVQTGLNRWRAVMAQSHNDSDAMKITVTLDAIVRSTGHITENETFHFEMSPQMARMLGGGSSNCHATAVAELNWVK